MLFSCHGLQFTSEKIENYVVIMILLKLQSCSLKNQELYYLHCCISCLCFLFYSPVLLHWNKSNFAHIKVAPLNSVRALSALNIAPTTPFEALSQRSHQYIFLLRSKTLHYLATTFEFFLTNPKSKYRELHKKNTLSSFFCCHRAFFLPFWS